MTELQPMRCEWKWGGGGSRNEKVCSPLCRPAFCCLGCRRDRWRSSQYCESCDCKNGDLEKVSRQTETRSLKKMDAPYRLP